MPRSRATWATGYPDSRTKRTVSALNVSGYDRRVFVLMLTSDFLILPRREVSVKSREGHIMPLKAPLEFLDMFFLLCLTLFEIFLITDCHARGQATAEKITTGQLPKCTYLPSVLLPLRSIRYTLSPAQNVNWVQSTKVFFKDSARLPEL